MSPFSASYAITKPFVVSSPKQLQIIAWPGREEIIDVVALIGPCRITELASVVGRSRNSLYYHVRALRDAGLLLETHRSGEGTKTTAYYDVPGRPLSVRFDLSTPSRRRAVLALARTRIRCGARGFEQACKPGAVTLEGPRRDLRVTHLKGWLSDQELEETNRLLERLVELVGTTERGATMSRKSYEFTFVLAPVDSAARQDERLTGSDKADKR
jgi:DNA-binding transcriptional ArsR family regulator